MGIFNKNIFKELEDGIKNFSQKVKENFNESKNELFKENQIKKCPNCGANIESGDYECKYCGQNIKPRNGNQTKREPNVNAQRVNYPVLVEFEEDEERFYAYDCQTDTSSEGFKSVANALEDLKKELQEIIDEGDGFKIWTEEQLSQKFYAKGRLKKGAKIKFVELEYIDPKNDPDW